MSISPPLCPLSFYLSVFQFIHLFDFPSLCLSAYLSFHLAPSLSFVPFSAPLKNVSISESFYTLSFYLFVFVYLCFSISLSHCHTPSLTFFVPFSSFLMDKFVSPSVLCLSTCLFLHFPSLCLSKSSSYWKRYKIKNTFINLIITANGYLLCTMFN
jgi:hypothetical protein